MFYHVRLERFKEERRTSLQPPNGVVVSVCVGGGASHVSYCSKQLNVDMLLVTSPCLDVIEIEQQHLERALDHAQCRSWGKIIRYDVEPCEKIL